MEQGYFQEKYFSYKNNDWIDSTDPMNETVCINEVYYTKKQLQDPDTLKKLFDKAEKEKDIKKKLDDLFYAFSLLEAVALGILSGSIFIGVASLLPFFLISYGIILKTNDVMFTLHKSRIQELYDKAVKLRDKSKEKNNVNIAQNCDKLIKAIEKHWDSEKEKKILEEYKQVKKSYKQLIDIVTKGTNLMTRPDPNLYDIADIVKIRYNKIDEGMVKNPKASHLEKPWKLWYGVNSKEEIKSSGNKTADYENMVKHMSEFESNESILVFYAIDDTIFCYSQKDKIFYYGDGLFHPECFKKSIYDFTKIIKYPDRLKKSLEYGKLEDYLKEADSELGYYLLNEPPTGKKSIKI